MMDLEEELGITSPDVNQLESLEKMINKAQVLAKQIEDMKATMETWQRDYFKITRHLIPDAMGAAGVSQFSTTSGLKVKIKEFVEGNLPKEDMKRLEAIKWLMDNGGADIIKGSVIVPFTKGDHNFKEEVKTVLRTQKIEFKETEEVHHSSLHAFAREKIRNGEEVPLDLLGLFAGRKAEIKSPDDANKEQR